MTTLDELRKANLQEQRRTAQPAPTVEKSNGTSAPPAPVVHSAAPPPPVMPEPATAKVESPEVAVPKTVTPEPLPEVKAESNGHAQGMSAFPNPSSDSLVAAVRKRLARRTMHQTGVKATVDMPPELFWRLKRYCRDNNNVTVRQVMLDLLMAYLDHEDY